LYVQPHSVRATAITDLARASIPLEDVQRLAGYADPRTTRLYDRRDKDHPQHRQMETTVVIRQMIVFSTNRGL
jgi:site-specific recombinase XerC